MVGVHERRTGVPQATPRTVACTSNCWFGLLHPEGGESVKKSTSKTPRTDRQPYITAGFTQFVKAGFARQIERQLAGANKRIKELEAKVNELHDLEKWLEGR
jgi:hypothetical protein